MKIDVKLSLNDEFVENYQKGIPTTRAASGWVEIEETFKFPIHILNSKNNEAFVKYPTVKKGDEYSNVLFPVDPDVRKEVNETILCEFKHMILKGIHTPSITDVRINLLKEPAQRGTIVTKAMASINICGFVINGISVKEGSKGPFVQMPQHSIEKDGKVEYHDTVYGTSSFAQSAIKNAVMEAYQQELKTQLKPAEVVNSKELNIPEKGMSSPKM